MEGQIWPMGPQFDNCFVKQITPTFEWIGEIAQIFGILRSGALYFLWAIFHMEISSLPRKKLVLCLILEMYYTSLIQAIKRLHKGNIYPIHIQHYWVCWVIWPKWQDSLQLHAIPTAEFSLSLDLIKNGHPKNSYSSIPRCDTCCFQNPNRSTKHRVSLLVVKCGKFSLFFSLEGMLWYAIAY